MEKAAGTPLEKKWGEINDCDRLMLIKKLCALEAELASIKLPANGSLYLRRSMIDGEKHEALDASMDPAAQFCVGPSCERSWFRKEEAASLPTPFDTGPCESSAGSFFIYLSHVLIDYLQGKSFLPSASRLWTEK